MCRAPLRSAKAQQWNGSATVDQWNWIIGSGSGVCKG